MLHTIIFIGRSGCGKGTQAALFQDRITRLDSDKRPILHVETGDGFRKFIRGNTFSSKLSDTLYKTDKRQPDFLAVYMWGHVLIEELGEDMHIVFDGAPRSAPEARVLTTALQFYSRERVTVIHLKVSRKWSEERLLARGRFDDKSLTSIGKRLDWYEEDVLPAVEYFKTNSFYRVIDIDGEQPIEKVHADIVREYEYNR